MLVEQALLRLGLYMTAKMTEWHRRSHVPSRVCSRSAIMPQAIASGLDDAHWLLRSAAAKLAMDRSSSDRVPSTEFVLGAYAGSRQMRSRDLV
jgi:hypothetical protein